MLLLGHSVGNTEPLFLVAGPCVLEPGSLAIDMAATLRGVAEELGLFFVFKASFDKANRTGLGSFRGIGFAEGLRQLEEVRRQAGVPVLTDVHEATPVDEVAAVVDILQTPAFLARQTDFIQRVARAKKPMNVKKAQFLSPWDMGSVVDKCRAAGNPSVMLCERGTCFGYNNLVVDMRSLAAMRATGCPVIFDATHSVQLPSALGHASGGDRAMVPVLARAAVAAGVAGLFMETHPNPDEAPCDGPNMWPLARMRELLLSVVEIDRVVKARPFAEQQPG